MKRRIIAIVAGVAVIAAGGVLIGRPLWVGRCSASFEEVPAAELTKLHAVPLDQVKVDDFDEEYRENVRNLLAVAQHPVAPLGQARSAVVVPHEGGSGAASLVNSNDGNVRFEVGGGGLIGTETSGAIVQVDGETGQPAWGRRQVGYGAGGGDLADRMVLMHTPQEQSAACHGREHQQRRPRLVHQTRQGQRDPVPSDLRLNGVRGRDLHCPRIRCGQ